MMTVYEFLAPGFEEAEAITPYDMLLRAGAAVKLVSVGKEPALAGAHGVVIRADVTAEALRGTVPDMIVLPGGMPGAKNLSESALVSEFLTEGFRKGAYIGAICAAPFVLGRLGILQGKKATCYPGFETELTGAEVVGDKVVRDGTVITAAGMGVALPFGKTLVEALYGRETANRVLSEIMA